MDWKHTNPRKSRIIGIATILILAGLFALSLLPDRPIARGPQQAKFLGFTHLAPGGLRNTFATNYTAFLHEWYATGTNVALFSITNQLRSPVLLYPYVGFFAETNVERSCYETLVLNADNGYGVVLRPGQAVTVEIAVLPGRGSGRVRFGYAPDYRQFVPGTIEMVRGLLSGKAANFHTEWFCSERIEP